MMKKRLTGRAWVYGDDVNTDVIYPGRYTYQLLEPQEIATHALEDLDPSFADAVAPGDIIVAGRNWGCGSSREQAVTCLKAAGVAAVVAKSFARIYYRNAINHALPIVTCDAVDSVASGEEITIDFAVGRLETSGGVYRFPPMADEVLAIMDAGGLIPYVRRQLGVE
jgi:3-isopropylmalate/(R)-2-methylmalate dehydratase small subunit